MKPKPILLSTLAAVLALAAAPAPQAEPQGPPEPVAPEHDEASSHKEEAASPKQASLSASPQHPAKGGMHDQPAPEPQPAGSLASREQSKTPPSVPKTGSVAEPGSAAAHLASPTAAHGAAEATPSRTDAATNPAPASVIRVTTNSSTTFPNWGLITVLVLVVAMTTLVGS
jgi:hypothetical protein